MAALTEADLSRAPAHRLAWRLATDDQLARAAARGSDAAFSAIYARYHPALVRHCRGVLLNQDEAEDAAQSAMAAAMRALRGSGPQPVALRPWLYRIAHHEALVIARRRPAPAPALEDLELPAVEDPAVRERLAELLGDLRDLPERQRAALLLRELSGLEYGEIAVALETSAVNARQLVSSARGALHEVGAGRAAACADVRSRLDEADKRALRGRGLRAHLADCGACTAYARAARARRRDLALLFPVGPGLALLGWLGGGGAAAGGGSWALGSALGGGVAAKCAVVCVTAVVGAVAVEETVVQHPPQPKTEASTPSPERRGTDEAGRSGSIRPSTQEAVAERPAKAERRKVAAKPASAARPAKAQQRTVARKQAVVQRKRSTSVTSEPSRPADEARQPSFTPDRPATTTPAAAPPGTVAVATTQPTPQTQPQAPTQERTAAPTIRQQVEAAQERVRQQVATAQQQIEQTITTALADTQRRVEEALAAMRQRTGAPSQTTTP